MTDNEPASPRPHPNPVVRVIIVNYNAGQYLRRCVETLLSQSLNGFEAVIVDNASTDGSLEGLATDPRLEVRRLDRNMGFAAANNLAAAGATTPLIAFLNPDAFPEPSWLERLVEAASANPDFHLFGSLQLQDDHPCHIDGAGDVYYFAGTAWRSARGSSRNQVSGRRVVFGACAAAALVRRDWFERLEGFDADYFCYFEDVDLAFRLRLLGGRVLQVNDAIVRHAGSVTAGAGSDFVVYHTLRNQIMTFIKCMPTPLLAIAAPAHVALVAAKLVRGLFAGRGRVVMRALADAMAAHRMIGQKRSRIQGRRVASTLVLARAISWSPVELLGRAGTQLAPRPTGGQAGPRGTPVA